MLSRIVGTHLSAGAARASCAATAPLLRRTVPLHDTQQLHSSQQQQQLRSGTDACGMMAPFLTTAKRFAQFEHTTDTMQGINKKKQALHSRWTTKSTKEYMTEADSKTTKGSDMLFSKDRERRKAKLEQRKDRFRDVASETDRAFELEMDRMRDDRGRRLKKGFTFFKRQGKAFTIVYFIFYFGTLGLLYLGFATGICSKEAAFEFLFFFLSYYINREEFFERVEAWDSYSNFGFAFVINELLEFIRFPLVMFFFYQARPYLTGMNRHVKGSIFRKTAVES